MDEFIAPPAPGSATVVVNHVTVVNEYSDRVGINANYWVDAESRRTPGARPQWEAYAELGAKYVRFPGGHKADGVTFFLDENGGTLTTPTPRLCRFGDGEWPATDATYWTPTNTRVGGSFSRATYGLQDFLDDCILAGAEPVIVTALDTVANPPTGTGAWTITKAQAIANAVEMVRWCNVTNNYNVKYWELGNESWSSRVTPSYTAGYPTAAAYGADFAEMATAMKAIDPTILVGLNWNSQAGYEDAIAAAGAANVDWLAAHRYPFFGTDYTAYLAIDSPNMVSEANRATNAIATLAAPHNTRIFTMMTETGFNSQPNNMGAAVIIAHILGAQLATDNIVSTMVWNTRYPPGGASHDAIGNLNQLLPSGMGQALAASLAPGKMIAASSSNSSVVAYASRQLDSLDGLGRVAVLLINRALTPNTVNVAVSGVSGGERYELSGTGVTDTAPTVTRSAITVTADLTPSLILPGISVTLLVLQGKHSIEEGSHMLLNPSTNGSQRGLISSIPRGMVHDATVATLTGNIRLSFFTPTRSAIFTSIRCRTGTTAAAATPTLCRMGVYSVADNGDLTLLSSHVNDTTLFAVTSTAYAKTLTSPVLLVAGLRYACAVLIVTAAAAPTFQGNIHLNSADAGLDERECGFVAAQTDLVASILAASVSDTTANPQFILVP